MFYGIIVPNFGPYFHPRVMAERAKDAEAAGWDGFFLWDHLLFGTTPVVDPWIALAAISMKTERIRLGTVVTPLPRRRPSKLIRETVSIDHLSGGRLTLGVGIGNGPWEWEYLGEEPNQRVRGDMLDEFLDVLESAWSGQPFRHEGEHYTIMGDLPEGKAQFLPAPLQQPRIPIWVGGIWPNKRPFRRSARFDGVVPMKAGLDLGEMMTPSDLEEIVEYVKSYRTSDAPFDVVISGHTDGENLDEDSAKVRSYEEVGATWWLETIDAYSFGWRWEGDWPIETMNERIVRGPPNI